MTALDPAIVQAWCRAAYRLDRARLSADQRRKTPDWDALPSGQRLVWAAYFKTRIDIGETAACVIQGKVKTP